MVWKGDLQTGSLPAQGESLISTQAGSRGEFQRMDPFASEMSDPRESSHTQEVTKTS